MKTIRITLAIILILIIVYAGLYLVRGENYYKANVKFCNEQGWAYSSGGSDNRIEIWCGAMINTNGEYGLKGITYPVEKKFFGGYKVKKGFDANKALAEQRFEEYCEKICKDDNAGISKGRFENLECGCIDLNNFKDYYIKVNYTDQYYREVDVSHTKGEKDEIV